MLFLLGHQHGKRKILKKTIAGVKVFISRHAFIPRLLNGAQRRLVDKQRAYTSRHTWTLLTWMRIASRCDSNENYCAFQQLLVTGTPSRTHLNVDKHINKLNICWCKSNIETKKSSVSRNNWCQTSVLYIVFVRSAVWWLVCVKLYDEYTFKYWTLYTKTT